MRVYIGPYPVFTTCNIYTRYLEAKYHGEYPEVESWGERLLEKVENAVQEFYNRTINKISVAQGQEVSVHIDSYDTYSMNVTLAHIVVPMLEQMLDDLQTISRVDLEDVPECLRDEENLEYEYNVARWEWVLGEMLFAFESKRNETFVEKYEQERVTNGFRLFGKYYEGLWT